MPSVNRVTPSTPATSRSTSALRNPRFTGEPTLANVAAGRATLTNGAKGEAVKRLQSALLELGYDLKPYRSSISGNMVGGIDGDFGNQTKNALLAFQRDAAKTYKDVKATGVLDTATIKALDALATRGTPETPAPVEPSAPSTTSPTLRNGRFAADTFKNIAAGRASLAPGAKGEAVKQLQTTLLDMGFGVKPYPSKTTGKLVGGPDGEYGNQTKTALLNFQRHAAKTFKDVKPTGTLDAATMKALDALAPAPGKKAWDADQNTKAPLPYFNGTQVRVVVVKDEHRTYLYDANGKVQGIFANSVGKAVSQTDTGLKVVRTRLDQKAAEATGLALWDNKTVFGPRILDLSWANGRSDGEELHGTNAPDQMGLDVSSGCVRHYNDDIIALFDALKVGDKVAIVDSLNDARLKK